MHQQYKFMGTRHLTMVIKDQKTRVAQYGQWDGYPEGQGRTILAFLANKKRVADLKKYVDNLAWVTKEDEADMEKLGDNWRKYWDHLSRDHGAKILDIIVKAHGQIRLQNQEEFAGESLHNEFSYVLDLDKDVLEVYKGFRTKPVPKTERFAKYNEKAEKESMEFGPDRKNGKKYKYYPVKLIKKYSFDNLPTVEQMKNEVDPDEE